MFTCLFLYSIFASALILWCSVHTNTRYVEITPALLNAWRTHCDNLIIFDLSRKSTDGLHGKQKPDSLKISLAELPDVLRWVPPNSRVIIYRPNHTKLFDPYLDELLFQADTNPIYMISSDVPASMTQTDLVSRESALVMNVIEMSRNIGESKATSNAAS